MLIQPVPQSLDGMSIVFRMKLKDYAAGVGDTVVARNADASGYAVRDILVGDDEEGRLNSKYSE